MRTRRLFSNLAGRAIAMALVVVLLQQNTIFPVRKAHGDFVTLSPPSFRFNSSNWYEAFSYANGVVPGTITPYTRTQGGSTSVLNVQSAKLRGAIDTPSYGSYSTIRWSPLDFTFGKLDALTLEYEGYERAGYATGNWAHHIQIVPSDTPLASDNFAPGILVRNQGRYLANTYVSGFDAQGTETVIASSLYNVSDGTHTYRLEINNDNGVYRAGYLRFYRDGALEATGTNITTFLADSNTIRFHMHGDDPVGATHTWDNVSIEVQPDFTVTAIEVTQAIQDLDNLVPLVAGKRTYARVHVHNQGTPTSALVTARLCGPGRCLQPGNSGRRIQILESLDRARLDQSFYFELPQFWLTGTVSLTAEVNPAGPQHVLESNTANNSLSQSIPFETVPPLKIKFFGVRYRTESSTGPLHAPRTVDYDLIRSWLRRAYPSARLQWSRAFLDYGYSGMGPPTCDQVNERLAIAWNLDRIENRIDDQTRYYGIVHDSGGFMRGCAMGIPATVASGPTGAPPGPIGAYWDEDASYGDWYAGHELAHTYGRYHPGFCRGQERDPKHPVGDYPEGRISPADGSMYGFDIESKAVYTPTGWFDVMTYCDNEWISDFTYKGIRDYLIADGNQVPEETTSVGEHLIVLGTVNHTQNSAELHTLYRVPDVSAPVPPVSGTHHLKLLDINNLILADYPFAPGKNTSTEPGEDQIGLISEIVPWIAGTQRVAVYSDTLELASRPVSANTPEVTVISPNGSEVFTDTMAVSWSASDADQDPLTYLIQYTPDDGATWQTAGVDITNTTVYTLDLTLLPGTDQGRIQVVASDGINTGMDASDGTFQVTRKPPQARVFSPVPNSAILFGQTVTLAGEGTDVEDGTLAEDALSWSSSLSGALGVGPLVGLTDLITGTHVITLTATDSDGNAGSATVGVVVSFEEDVVPDCQVNILDIQAIASRWQQHVGDIDWDGRFDLDGDGTITTVDIMRVTAAWGTVCQ